MRSLTLVIATSISLSAQAPPEGSQTPVFRSGASLVALNGTVTDGKHFVGGLLPDDFEVYEDNVRQRVEFFETRKVPLDLILLIDCSSSMRDKIGVVHEAAEGFLRTLRPIDRGAVVAFSDAVTILAPLTGDRPALEAAVRKTQANGGTALNTALYVALREFGRPTRQPGEPVRRQAIALLSDGADTSSLISFDDMLAVARKSDVSIYTIAVTSPTRDPEQAGDAGRRFLTQSDFAMKTLAVETGGQAYFPANIQEIKGVYARIADELSNQYSIAYSPTDARLDGRFRRVVVRVSSRPGLQPRFRTGYVADTARTVLGLLRGR